jgi:DNA-binding LytR/AlgR family response regulator
MARLNCVVIDDEPLAQECITKYVERIEYLQLRGTGCDPIELTQILNREKIDLIFLDIQMPLMNGIDYLKVTNNLPMVIITTAYPTFALDGFSLDVVDYLLKPITFDRFFKAVNKANDYHKLVKKHAGDSNASSRDCEFFFIKCDTKYERIYFNDILYVQALQNYVTIHTEKGRYITHLSLRNVEENLNQDHFIKIHKSYVVSVSKIDSIENNDVLIQSIRIPVGRNYRENLLDRTLKKNLWKKS